MTGQRFLVVSSSVVVAAGLLLLGDQAYLEAKAWLARRLVANAWADHLRDGLPHRPWRWADFHPVARIVVPRLGTERIVLTGATGSALAFGLGHVSGTALPGQAGSAAVAGHRDGWARFLGDMRVGDTIVVETRAGREPLRVVSLEVVPRERVEILEPDPDTRLTLVTCYPFDGLVPSPKRYVVRCARARGDVALRPEVPWSRWSNARTTLSRR